MKNVKTNNMLLFENGGHPNLREETLVILRAALLHYNYEVYDTHTQNCWKKGVNKWPVP